MAKKYYWLKMETDYLTSPKIKKLRKIAGGDTYTIIYLKMQLLSVKNGGVLEYSGIEPSFSEELALILDEDVDNVKITVSFLESMGLLVAGENGEFLLPEAAEKIGTESESIDRVRSFRKRKAIRDSISLCMVKKLSNEQILLPDGNVKFIDNKRYGGNAEYVYELAECKCEICGETDSKKLLIHHNNGYSNDLDDLYLLCNSCHGKVESGKLKCESHKRKNVTCNSLVTDSNTDKEIYKSLELIDNNKNNNNKEEVKRKRFSPPTFDEIKEYCKERKNTIDPKRFYDFYSTPNEQGKTWVDSNGKPVRNWKQKIITWEGRQQNVMKNLIIGNDCDKKIESKWNITNLGKQAIQRLLEEEQEEE